MIRNNLSLRLQMIASIVPQGVNFADIGADHGYLIQYLKQSNLINEGYASDNKKGPYLRLKENLKNDNISVDLADGIINLPSTINCVCIAGMGGDTIVEILKQGKNKLNNVEYLVISSHCLFPEVRKYLFENGYSLIDQNACFDPYPHYYEVNLFQKKPQSFDTIDIEYGRYLIKGHNLAFIEYTKLNIEKINQILKKENLPIDKIQSLKKDLDQYENLLKQL